MWKYYLSLCLTLTLATPSSAQVNQGPVEICFSTGHHWKGNTSDIENIYATPIPETFRREFENNHCSYLRPISLILWHRKYGSEATMTTALDYLKKGTITKTKLGSKLPPKDRVEQYAKVATYYNVGAEAFESMELVKAAEKHLKEAKKYNDKLSSDLRSEVSWSIGKYYRDSYDGSAVEKLSREIAVTKALISGKLSDIEQAHVVLAHANMPFMQEFISHSYDYYESICDLWHLEWPKGIQEACEKSGENYDRDVRHFLLLQTLLATVDVRASNTKQPKESYELYSCFDRMLRVVEAEFHSDTRSNNPKHLEQRARLNLAFSDMHYHLALTAVENQQLTEVSYNIDNSLDQLLAAERHLPRHTYPSQWRRIAIRFVESFELQEKYKQKQKAVTAEREQQLQYFKDGLKSYEKENVRP